MPSTDDGADTAEGAAEMKRLVAWDRHMGLLSLAMWGGTAVKVAPKISMAENMQAWMGMATIALLAVAWPTLGYRSYVRWRTPAIAFLRIALFALPFNFSRTVFDALAPHVQHGRAALMVNIFQLFMSIRIALLNFTSMGWRVPFRLHMLLQAINIAILIRFGLHPYCGSVLLSSPEMEAAAAAVHSVMAFVAMVFVPSTAIIVPEGAYAQRVAALLFCWVTFGWLLPTLMLVPEAGPDRSVQSAPERQRHVVVRAANHIAELLETWLRMLLPLSAWRPPTADAAAAAQQLLQLPPTVSCTLHWWAVLLVTWGVCCTAAPWLA